MNQMLFRKYTKNAQGCSLSDCQFAALLATTRDGAEKAIHAYIEVADAFGLSVSIQKTKLLVLGVRH